MYATLIVQSSGSLDENYSREDIPVGSSIKDVIGTYGEEMGYDRSMVALINNVQIRNYDTVLNADDVLVFRVGSKERG